MASVRGILNIQSLNELTYENACTRTARPRSIDRTRPATTAAAPSPTSVPPRPGSHRESGARDPRSHVYRMCTPYDRQ